MRPENTITMFKAVAAAARTLASTRHPLLAQLVVIRRCNLDCAYCNEYDAHSPPVPLPAIQERVAALARLGTAAITCTGGEPTLHPDLPAIIRAIRGHGIIATLITNGSLLTAERIAALNDAGLQEMQISIDNIEPDEVSSKSLRGLGKKLDLLAEHARFKVNINSVLGLSDERTVDALAVAEAARERGFSHSVAIVHDDDGIMKPLSRKQHDTYKRMGQMSGSRLHRFNYRLFQKNLIEGRPNDWKCRAGARFLYVCEHGLVHWCSQQRGYPGIPVTQYTADDIQREFNTKKSCSPRCTLGCVHQMSFLDEWRPAQQPLAADGAPESDPPVTRRFNVPATQ